MVKGEALVRLEAERRLLDRYRNEYDRLSGRRGHVDAVRGLVKNHKVAYDGMIRDARQLVRGEAPETGSSRAA